MQSVFQNLYIQNFSLIAVILVLILIPYDCFKENFKENLINIFIGHLNYFRQILEAVSLAIFNTEIYSTVLTIKKKLHGNTKRCL